MVDVKLSRVSRKDVKLFKILEMGTKLTDAKLGYRVGMYRLVASGQWSGITRQWYRVKAFLKLG